MAYSARENCGRWKARLENTRRSADEQKRMIWDNLEHALSGEFPDFVDPSRKAKRVIASEQIDHNLLLWASTYYRSISYTQFPEFSYARDIQADPEVVQDNERTAARLFDEGGGMEESAEAMQSSMSRGVFMLWVDVEDEDITPEEVRAASMSPGDFTQQAIERPGEPIEIPEGADYEGIFESAEFLISAPESVMLQPEQLTSLRMLSDTAKLLHQRSLKGPHPASRSCRIKFSATPYGTWAWWDVSVTRQKAIGFLIRKLVYAPERFLASNRFNGKAKKYVRDRFDRVDGDAHASGGVPGQTGTQAGSTEDVDARERVTVYEIWDRVNWKRLALVDGFDEFAHASDEYPYLGSDGRPVLRGFFPCAIRVPIKASVETPEGMTGTPLLEPGWPAQLEYIKVMSAYIQATKRSARQAVFASGLANEWITAFMNGKDASGQSLPPSYDATKHGPPVTMMDWGPAPIDYLQAANEIRREFCMAVHIAQLTMTSESPNPNLGQDQLAVAGAATMQGAVLRSYESGTAEAVEIALTLLRNFASTEEITSYLGPGSDFREPIFKEQEAVDPMSGLAGTVQKPVMVKNPETGAMEQATKPSRVDKFRAVSLDRDRLLCRFAVNVEGDTAVRVKQMQDYIALNNSTPGPLGVPTKDPGSLMDELADMQNIRGVQPYDETKAMLAMQAASMGGGGGEGSESEGGGDETGRKKGDQRGAAGIPKQQERSRGPQSRPQMSGAENRV